VTGKPYRLLSEAEYEYAARAGTTTAYPWGDDIKLNGQAMATCLDCGSKWDNAQAAPVGSFAPNQFGLFDMVGNVWEWVEDCIHVNYAGAPMDGSAWIEGGNCQTHIVRGGSWSTSSVYIHSGNRYGFSSDHRSSGFSFRIARTLAP
jgi:formylglycine-generating enzyme required for sulfatase activity